MVIFHTYVRVDENPFWGSPKYPAFDSFPDDKLCAWPRFALHSAQREDQSSPNFGSFKCPEFPGGKLKKRMKELHEVLMMSQFC